MKKQITTSYLIQKLGVSRQRLHQLATERGIQRIVVPGRAAVWPSNALEQLQNRGVGGRPSGTGDSGS